MRLLSGDVVAVAALLIGQIAVFRWRRQRRSIIEGLGLRWDLGSAIDLLAGLSICALVMLGIFVCELWAGGISRTGLESGVVLPTWQTLAVMLIRAAEEELLDRSLLLSGLAVALRGRSFLAILLSALVFGIAHLTNPGASAISTLGNALGGLVYGYAFVMSGRIWLPLGLHLGWNLIQGPVLGFPVSGQMTGGLQHLHDLGPAWLTGGAYGPEAGVVGISFRFVEFGLVFLYMRFGHNKERTQDFQQRVA